MYIIWDIYSSSTDRNWDRGYIKKVGNKTRHLFLAPNSSVFIGLKTSVDSFSYVYVAAVDLHLLALLYLSHICNPG